MKRNRLYLYLLLNVIVSAVTTLIVLTIWDSTRKPDLAADPALSGVQATLNPALSQPASGSPATITPAPSGPTETALAALRETAAAPKVTATLPPAGTPVIEISNVVGAGDLENEVVQLKRLGEGNLSMAGWKLVGEHNNTYIFPAQPELILYKEGAVQVFTKAGSDSVFQVFWNRDKAAWQPGETLKLLDREGTERATYIVP